MDLFILASYGYDAAGVPHLIAAAAALFIGTGLLLYERFTPASKRFFYLALVLAGWLASYAASFMSVDPVVKEFWYRLGLVLTALGFPFLYALALQLTGRRRPRTMAAPWIGCVAMVAIAAGPLTTGIRRLNQGEALLSGATLAALVFIGILGWVLALAVREFLWGGRHGAGAWERRRHRAMLVAVGLGSVGLVDFFVPAGVLTPAGLAPFAVIASLSVMGFAGARYRTFSLSARFATDEILRAMGDAVLVCDPDGVVRVANARAEALLGAPERVLVGSPVRQWFRSRDGTPLPDLPEGRPLSEAMVRDRTFTLAPAGGGSIEVSVSIERIGSGGDSRGIVVVIHDIRERVEAERALAAAEKRYRSLFWHNPVPAYELDLEGRVRELNPAAERLVGRPVAEVRGEPLFGMIHPVDVEKAKGLFDAVRAGSAREYEIGVRVAGGERIEMRGMSVPILDEAEQVVGVFGVALDITEVSRTKEAMKLQRRYFADLFENSPEGIVLVDAETDEVLRINAEFSHMFGYTSEEAVGQKLCDLIVPEEMTDEGLELNASAREAGRVRSETVRRCKDGSVTDVSVLARKLTIPGEREQLYGIYRDITHRKETELQLRQREEELRHAQKLEAVGKLAGGIAHDFNNLLTVMNGHARLALEAVDSESDLAGDLQEIEKAGSRAASLTQQLLAYSRRQVLHPQRLDANEVVVETQEMFRRLIGEHIHMDGRLSDEAVGVHVDRGQLEQVLTNLVVNARDAMPDGGTLTIETGVLEIPPGDDRIKLWQVAPGSFVRIRVADTGEGMSETILTRAFEPFFTTKEPGKGTGLGLATVFGIVKQSGGHVEARSKPGRGAEFDVILPRHDSASPPGRTPESVASSKPSKGTVLVVEDEDAVRNLVIRVLEREGCTVLSAANGVRALETLDRHTGPLDLVITDLVMPDMGGRELASRLEQTHPDLPILFMSGYDEELADVGKPDGDLLAKPFDLAELTHRVGMALRRVSTR